jgi:O-antigen/teichoic acid export membrane protein
MATIVTGERLARPVRRLIDDDFLRHGMLVFAATTAGNVLNYAFNFALSRRLGVEGFATLSSLTSFIMIFSVPASIVTLVVVKYTATFHAAGDAARIRRLSHVLLKWTAIAALCALAAGILLRGSIAAFLRIQDDAVVPLCMAILALSFITPSVRGVLQGEQDFMRYSTSTFMEVFLKVTLGVTLGYIGFGVAGAMAGWIAGTFCALLYTVWAVLRKHGAAGGPAVHLSFDVRRILETTGGVGLASALLIVLSFMDVLLVKHYLSPRDAGLYAAVNMTGKVVLFLAGFVPAVLLPKTVAKTTRGEDCRPLMFRAIGVTVLMSGAALFLFGVDPALAVRVLAGPQFAPAAPYVLQYDGAMALLALVTLFVNYKIGIHSFRFLYGLGAVLAMEIAAIAFYHGSIWSVIHILLAGNALALVAVAL